MFMLLPLPLLIAAICFCDILLAELIIIKFINDASLLGLDGIILHEESCLILLQRLLVIFGSITPADSLVCFDNGYFATLRNR